MCLDLIYRSDNLHLRLGGSDQYEKHETDIANLEVVSVSLFIFNPICMFVNFLIFVLFSFVVVNS